MTAFPKATVYLLAAVLLVCPYFCLASVAAAVGTSVVRKTASAGCDCCPRPDEQGGEQCPAQGDSRQGSGACLCHGAVMDRHVESPDLPPALVTCLPPDAGALVRQSLAVGRASLSEQPACHFPAADSGREVRALIASLLL